MDTTVVSRMQDTLTWTEVTRNGSTEEVAVVDISSTDERLEVG